ncbi:MAG: hypothetical protein LBS21_09735 [Clostridiales bacterium]|jgi:hypothetical protein|nr:hypothetical protein [Clostridiales bacterium]
MILRNCTLSEFIKRIERKKLVCFGAGDWVSALCVDFPEYNLEKYISYIVDNNLLLREREKSINGTTISIFSPEKLINEADKNTVILITSRHYFKDIFSNLNSETNLKNVDCYFSCYIYETQYQSMSFNVPDSYRANLNRVIPKLIHYFWFGGKPMPEQNKRFIDSWRKFCPDYDIIEWNENNYDFSRHPFTKEAAKEKMWSKVASYARFDVVYKYGGIYMDTDVEVIKPLDELLYNNGYIGFESRKRINGGSGFGAVKNFNAIREIRDYFDNIPFKNKDGTCNLTACPEYETASLIQYGFKRLSADFQIINGLTVYPMEFFNPILPFTMLNNFTKNTFSIHHYDISWVSQESKDSREFMRKLYKQLVLE